MEKLVLIPQKNFDRLDAYIAENTDISRSRAVKLIESGEVTVNGNSVNKKASLKEGDRVEVVVPDAVPLEAKAQDIPLDILYEDGDLLVVNKPKGMVVHPAAGNFDGTLVNALLSHCKGSLSGIGGVMRPGIIHRIDKNTSGLLMVAKNDASHQHLAAQIKAHSFVREYEAVVYGNLKDDSGVINAPIGRHPVKRKQMAVTDKNSKEAVTHYTVIKRYNGFTHVRCRLETGRTHQIRVHMAYIGHSLAGDDVYGPKKVIKELGGQCLHAKKLGFIHPDGRYLEFESELPAYFKAFLLKLEGKK
ncbi:MAG: RluA family pseudouridine synthase [Clostridia bacterium]|nr:RluA family pseudouridine synthase [Clostridia bacterium]